MGSLRHLHIHKMKGKLQLEWKIKSSHLPSESWMEMKNFEAEHKKLIKLSSFPPPPLRCSVWNQTIHVRWLFRNTRSGLFVITMKVEKRKMFEKLFVLWKQVKITQIEIKNVQNSKLVGLSRCLKTCRSFIVRNRKNCSKHVGKPQKLRKMLSEWSGKATDRSIYSEA